MTLLQLIAHLKEVYEEHGNLEVKVGTISPEGTEMLWDEDIEVNPELKIITFT